MKSDFFIDKPIFSSVISILIVIVGVVGLVNLPIDQYPQIVPPVVRVSASYPGASAQAVSQAVATPIEQEINGTPGMLYMESSNTNTGSYSLEITFDISVDPDLAAVEVQNRVKEAESRLPAEVVQNGISVEKQSSSKLMTITLQSSDDKFDEIYLSNYATLNVVDMLKRVPGVGRVSSVGGRYYAMQIWVQPDKMASLGISVKDIQNALKDQNRESAAGVLGQQPVSDVDVTIPIKVMGRLSSVAEFEDIVIRASDDGSVTRLKDVARVSLEAQSYNTESGINGENAAVLNINMLPGENAVSVAEGVKEAMEEISASFPEGISYDIPFDMTTYISESIHEVYKTLFEALILVILVVFLSLQSWRSTLIPAIAVPISLVGTFGVMLIMGYSLNMMTLLGLILAIGIVVDDAIVVVENVDRIMTEERLSAKEATKKAMSEIGGALVAMSLVLCAVFIPVSFLSGITGQMFRQFSLTIAVSVIISTVVALTLSPAMCAILLRPEDAQKARDKRLFMAINNALTKGNGIYTNIIANTIVHRRRMLAFWGIACVGIWLIGTLVPQSFIPKEDQGYFTVELELPVGSTLERTRVVSERAVDYLLESPDVAYVMDVVGSSPRVGSSQGSSTLTVILKPWKERKHKNMTKFIETVRSELSQYPESKVYITTPAVIPGLGSSGGFSAVLEAKGDCSYDELRNAADTLLFYAAKEPSIGSISLGMQDDIPQLYFNAERDKIQMLGVPLSDVFSTLKAFTGSIYVNDFNMYNRVYRVYIQADASYRARQEDLNLYAVKSSSGQMVPVTALGSTEYITGPGTIKKFNMFTSAGVNGEPSNGSSTGQAMDAIERIVEEHLPSNIGLQWSGLSFQEKKEGGQTAVVLGLCLLFVFLILSALYESWTIPIAVILSLPISILGAYLGISVFGLENNVYFQIGLVVLVGLVAKNAILIVEFAKKEMDAGKSPSEAAVYAAGLRFRPIVMTSLSFILGLIPLVFATGPGSASRVNIGMGVFWGMLVGVTVGLVFVPFFFTLVNSRARIGKKIRNRINIKKILPLAVLLIGFGATSCSPARLCLKPDTGLPASYDGSVQDSLSMADAKWWEFYQDEYLKALIDSALANNKDLVSAYHKVEEYRLRYRVEHSRQFPSFSGQAAVDDEYNNYRGAGGKDSPEVDLKLSMNWELDLWGKYRWASREKLAEYLSTVEARRALEMSIIAEVATAYYELLELDNNLAIVRKTLQTREESAKQAKLRFDGGLTSETAYQQALVELSSTSSLIPEAERNVALKESALAFLTGTYPFRIPRSGEIRELESDKLPLGVSSQLLERRPDIRAAALSFQSAEAAVGVAQASRLPSLSLNLSGGLESDSFTDFLKSPFYYALGNLTSPVFNFGRLKAGMEASVEVYNQVRSEYEKVVLQAFREVYDASLTLRYARENTKMKHQLEDAAAKYVDLSRLQYINGVTSYIDVLDAQRRYFDAQIELNKAIMAEHRAVVSLYKALGGGF